MDSGIDFPTKRAEWEHLDGSNPERVPGKQGELPRPLRRKRRQRLRFPSLPWVIPFILYGMVVFWSYSPCIFHSSEQDFQLSYTKKSIAKLMKIIVAR
jgi:hypothetical protein